MHDVGQESGGRYGEGIGGQQSGGQGIPAESGRCRYAVLGAQGQEQPYQGRHRKGARHNRQRDQKDPEPGGPNIPDQAALPAHIQAHQKEEQVQPPADDRATVGYGGVGEQEAAHQNARRYGEDDGEGQAVVHVDRLPGTLVAVLRCLLAGTALSVQLQQIFSQGVDSQHAAHHGGEGDRQGVEPNGAQGRDDLLVGPQLGPQGHDQQQSRRLKPAQPGHGKGLDLGAGAQKGPKSHQSQIEDQIKKGAGHLLQRDHS